MVLNADAILISSGVDYKRAVNGVQNAWTKTEIAVSEIGNNFYFKGTVSRDFRLLVFFMNQFPLIP
jgi:hypothetical protein